jgi:prepilin signal peptidase PulO-like enzyme (type II secretory pathway)
MVVAVDVELVAVLVDVVEALIIAVVVEVNTMFVADLFVLLALGVGMFGLAVGGVTDDSAPVLTDVLAALAAALVVSLIVPMRNTVVLPSVSPGSGRARRRRQPRIKLPWTLNHDEPVRTDKVYRYAVVTLVPSSSSFPLFSHAGMAGPDETLATGPPPDNTVSWDKFVFLYNPGYREATAVVSQTVQANSPIIRALDFAAASPAGLYVPAADPPIYITNRSPPSGDPLRARCVDAHIMVKVKAGASTFGTLVVGKLGANLRGLSSAAARAALMADFHTVKRFDIKGGVTTLVLPAGLANRESYGDFHTGSGSTGDTYTQEPFSGWIIACQSLSWASTDPPPTITFMTMESLQTELSLDVNHLQCTTKQVPVHAAATSLTQSAGLDKVRTISGDTQPKDVLHAAHAARVPGGGFLSRDMVGMK